MRKTWISLLALMLVAWIILPVHQADAAGASVYSRGSFIQPTVVKNWTVQDWSEELGYLKEVGNELIILQWTADSRYMTSIYPTSIPGFTKDVSYVGNPIENLLTAADAIGMEVWLGTNNNDDWYIHHATNKPWLDTLFDYSEQFVAELQTMYGAHASLTGYYFTNEMENCSYQDPTSIQNLKEAYSSLADLVHSYPGKTLSLAPAIWQESWCGQTYETNSSAWETTWDGILSGADIDYLIPQDGLGGGYHTNEQVVTWYQFMKSVVDRHPATELWADVETFHTISSNPWIAEPMAIRDVVQHMIQISPYVENIITFSYDHYQSPKIIPNPLYHQAYKAYYETGIVDSTGPAVPAGLMSTRQGTDQVLLQWNSSPDTVYYIVYRDGVKLGRTNSAAYQDSSGLAANTTYSYQVEAYGVTGYPSALSQPLQVTTVASAVVLSANKPYASSTPANMYYADTDGKELTDGVWGGSDFLNAAWQGRSNEQDPLVFSFTVDLGLKQRIDAVTMNFFQDVQSAIKLPKSVEYLVSDDNTSFASIGVKSLTPGQLPPDKSPTQYGIVTDSHTEGRYVKAVITSQTYGWTFIDEMRVEQYPTNVAIHQSYTSSKKAHPHTPDESGQELTDGVFGTASYTDEAWQGRTGSASFSYTIDLGASQSLTRFEATFLRDDEQGIRLPSSVEYAVSNDNLTFQAAGTVMAPTSSDLSTNVYRLTPTQSVSGRYVKVTVTPSKSRTFIDEIQIIR